ILRALEDCIELAPLHNPANIQGITSIADILGSSIPQVAVFDTAFHASMPEKAWLYALPYSTYRRHKIRRYGFHGTSYRYVSKKYRELSGVEKKDCNLIIFHLGNGCSAAALREGLSIDTSMGMTPTEGLVMGTRSGDVDPSVIEMIGTKEGLSFHEVQAMINRQSGLLGISGITSDMRDLVAEVEEHNDRRAQLAIDIFFDAEANKKVDKAKDKTAIISKSGSPIEVRVIPTNEEIMIARDTLKLIKQ
ncbi:MAG: acetate kinase, partial [Proteobacteria bacterium]